jgi:hypothetical protein
MKTRAHITDGTVILKWRFRKMGLEYVQYFSIGSGED